MSLDQGSLRERSKGTKAGIKSPKYKYLANNINLESSQWADKGADELIREFHDSKSDAKRSGIIEAFEMGIVRAELELINPKISESRTKELKRIVMKFKDSRKELLTLDYDSKREAYKKRIDAAKTHDEIESIVREAKQAGYAKNLDTLETYAISKQQDIPIEIKPKKKESKIDKYKELIRTVENVGQLYKLMEEAENDGIRRVDLDSEYDKRMNEFGYRVNITDDYIPKVGDKFTDIQTAKEMAEKLERATAKNYTIAFNQLGAFEIVEQTKKQVESGEKFEKDIAITEMYKAEIRKATTNEEIEHLLNNASRSALSNRLMQDIEHVARSRKEHIKSTESIPTGTQSISKIAGVPERESLTDISLAKDFMTHFVTADTKEVKKFKTVKDINDYFFEDGMINYEFDYTKNNAVLMDSSKAAAVIPKWNTSFQDFMKHELEIDKDSKVPILPFEGSAIKIHSKDGESFTVVSGSYFKEFMKIAQKNDIKWYCGDLKNGYPTPIIGLNEQSGERLILAPIIAGSKGEKDYGEFGLDMKRPIDPETKAFYTDNYLYVKMPNGRAIRIAKTVNKGDHDWDKAFKNATYTPEQLNGIPDDHMWHLGFELLTGQLEMRTREDIVRGSMIFRDINPHEATFNPGKSMGIFTDSKDFQEIKTPLKINDLKLHEDKEEKRRGWKSDKYYKVSLNGSDPLLYREEYVRVMKELAGPNINLGLNEKGLLIANIDGFGVQIGLAPVRSR